MVSAFAVLGYVLALCSCAEARTRYFAVEVGWGQVEADGYTRPAILVNGTSPGPPLIIDQGDDVEFYVRNNLDRSTSIHFHGIEQLGTPWSDGVPGLSQKPIPEGGDWLYKWTATGYGTYWYHSHYQAQMMDGMFGAIHIRPRRSTPRPFETITDNQQELDALLAAEQQAQLIMVSDWQHITADQFFQAQRATNIDFACTQSILFNGKGKVNCLTEQEQRAALAPPFLQYFQGPLSGTWLSPSGCVPFTPFTQGGHENIRPNEVPSEITDCEATDSPLQDYQVDPATHWVSFNFISATSIQAPVISLDEHEMWVYAVDGRYIVPYKVHGLQIFSGGRYSVMVRLDRSPGTYTLRASNFGLNQLISGFATVTYANGGGNGGSNGPDEHDGYPIMPHSGTDSPRPGYEQDTSIKREDKDFSRGSFDVAAKKGRDVDGEVAAFTEGHISRRQQGQSESRPYFTYGGFRVSPEVGLLSSTTKLTGFPNVPPALESQQTRIFYMSRFTAPWIWTVDGDEFYPSFPKEYAEDEPLLYYPDREHAQNPDLVTFTENGTWVDLVFVSRDTLGPPHPMHKHGNKAYVIGIGTGDWTWNTVAEAAAAQPQNFNFETPLLRDGFNTLPGAGAPSWLVVRYHSANPGAWMLHCHIQTHLSGGMAVALLDGVDDFPRIPREYSVDGNGL